MLALNRWKLILPSSESESRSVASLQPQSLAGPANSELGGAPGGQHEADGAKAQFGHPPSVRPWTSVGSHHNGRSVCFGAQWRQKTGG